MLLDFNHLIDKYKIQIRGIVHIGAHYGQEQSLYLKNGIQNIIYFEPLSKNFEQLRNNVGDGATLYNFALGNEEKEIEMFVERANSGQSSSILEPKIHLQMYPHITFEDREMVKMKKLDSFNIDESKFNFINIDVQGYELEVFKGATKTLPFIDYIISEVNKDFLYENCTIVNDLDKFLSDFGFVRTEVSWVGGNWGDALYIKK